MFWKNWIAALAVMFVCTTSANAAPLDAYGRLPTFTGIAVSPDGRALAYVRGNEAKRVIVVQALGTNQLLGGINIGNAKLRALEWADSHTIVYTTSVTALPHGLEGRREEWTMASSYDYQTKAQHALLEYGLDDVDTLNFVTGPQEPRIIDGKTYLFVRGFFFPADVGHLGLFRVALPSNSVRLVSRKTDVNARDWVVDEAGNIVAETAYFEPEQHWKLIMNRDGDRTIAVDVPAPIEGPAIEGLSEDGTAVVLRLPSTEGPPIYQQISLKDGVTTKWHASEPEMGELMASIRTGRVIGASRTSDVNDYVFFDAHAQAVWRGIKSAFKGATNTDLVSWSGDWTKVVARVFGGPYGDGYFLVDLKTHKADPIGPAYDGIDEVAPVKWIEYSAGDGRNIHAYLTTPLGREAKNLPLIVLPHGGPAARDEPGFDWISQALASRGYVVLQPQFRGSDGYGQDLLTAGYGEFGKKMQTDLSDGVRALAAQGLIDPKRVCIVGASYGGYAALAGATLDTGVYRCAVSIAGPSDLREMLRNEHPNERAERYWTRFMGVADRSDPKLDLISPIKHVDKVTIPILLIHGKDDTVVPFAQSDDMADALKDAKKPYEFVVLKGEDHWLSKSETRLQMLQATVKFLETNNPPDPAVAAAAPGSTEKSGTGASQQ